MNMRVKLIRTLKSSFLPMDSGIPRPVFSSSVKCNFYKAQCLPPRYTLAVPMWNSLCAGLSGWTGGGAVDAWAAGGQDGQAMVVV